MFEALWTAEPAVVRDVARVAADIAAAQQPALEQFLGEALRGPTAHTYDTVRAATALTNRAIGYLAAPSRAPTRRRR